MDSLGQTIHPYTGIPMDKANPFTVGNAMILDRYLDQRKMGPIEPLLGQGNDHPLAGAALVEAKFDPIPGDLLLLLDTRQAELAAGNVVILIAEGVEEIRWMRGQAHALLNVHPIDTVEASYEGDRVRLDVFALDQSRLVVTARSLGAVRGTVLGLGDAPPNLVELGEYEVSDGWPNWNQEFDPIVP